MQNRESNKEFPIEGPSYEGVRQAAFKTAAAHRDPKEAGVVQLVEGKKTVILMVTSATSYRHGHGFVMVGQVLDKNGLPSNEKLTFRSEPVLNKTHTLNYRKA